jgi:putative SOS response-associated peptidase YedK
VVESCSILTTAPNSLFADVHDRMPVILSPEHSDLWLDPGFRRVDALKGVLSPFDARLMRCCPVNTRINAVTNDDEDCVVPTDSSLPAQSALFG